MESASRQSTPSSASRLCEEHLRARYDLEVIDIYQQPMLAQTAHAAPTLIKQLPPPLRRIIGDMSNNPRVLVALDLRPGN